MKQNFDLVLQHLDLPAEFPRNFFPPEIEAYRQHLVPQFSTQDDFIVAPMVATASAAIGDKVRLKLTAGWAVTASLFAAMVGAKGAGKTPPAKKVTSPLIEHEQRFAAAHEEKEAADEAAFINGRADKRLYEDEDGDESDALPLDGGCAIEDEEDETVEVKRPKRSRVFRRTPPPPPIVLNDATMAGLFHHLGRKPRQTLLYCDELAKVFDKGKDKAGRQELCNLADGTTIRRSRGNDSPWRQVMQVDSPYLVMLGGLTPDMLQTAYGKRGDDGLVDRFLLFGAPDDCRARWPGDVDDAEQHETWNTVINRLLAIEKYAANAIDDELVVTCTSAALAVFEKLADRMNALADAIQVPTSQRGAFKKMLQHAAKLALIRGCLVWALEGKPVQGPLRQIDKEDAEAASEAAMFLLGRWILWRPELRVNLAVPALPFGLNQSLSDDPALLSLMAAAAASLEGIHAIGQLVEHLRRHPGPLRLAELSSRGPFATKREEDIFGACEWLVRAGHAEWVENRAAIHLFPIDAHQTARTRATAIEEAPS